MSDIHGAKNKEIGAILSLWSRRGGNGLNTGTGMESIRSRTAVSGSRLEEFQLHLLTTARIIRQNWEQNQHLREQF